MFLASSLVSELSVNNDVTSEKSRSGISFLMYENVLQAATQPLTLLFKKFLSDARGEDRVGVALEVCRRLSSSNEAAWYVNAKFTQPADSQRRPGKG